MDVRVPRRKLRPLEKGGEEVGLREVGQGTKRMGVTDGNWTPLGVALARESRAEIHPTRETTDAICVPCPRGRPRKHP